MQKLINFRAGKKSNTSMVNPKRGKVRYFILNAHWCLPGSNNKLLPGLLDMPFE
jgi:hypothetical protein